MKAVSSSRHRLNADTGLSTAQRAQWLVFNWLNNRFASTGMSPVLLTKPFTPPNGEGRLTEVDPLSSPSRQLSDLFWLTLPWDRLETELGEIHMLDIGCGSGNHAAKFQAWSGGRLKTYVGLDVVKDERWVELARHMPGVSFVHTSAHQIEGKIPTNTNLIVSQSTFEHVEKDLIFFRQISDFTRRAGRPTIHIHLVPASACLRLYPWHGVRQYTPRTLNSLFMPSADHSLGYIISLGNQAVNRVHWRFITKPWLLRRRDGRKVHPKLYMARTRRAITGSFGQTTPQPSFYALIIQAHPGSTVFI